MRATLIITVTIFALIGGAFEVNRDLDRNYGQPTRELSKMMSVRLIIGEALSSHLKQHGSYPPSLSELPLARLPWGDEGSSPRDLNGWHYSSDGQSFTMTWTHARGLELFLGGRDGQLFYSKGEAR
jgi:hypothetical protein